MAFETYSPEKVKKPALTAHIQPTPMTVARALELRKELNKELHCTTCLLNDPSFHKEDWAPKIKSLIEQHHKECEDMQKHIDLIFETTEIVI